MDITFISTMEGEPWGGSEELWSQAAVRLKQAGHYVHVNVKRWPAPAARIAALAQAGCRTVTRPSLGYAGRALRRFWADPQYRWLDSVRNSLVVISQGWQFEAVGWGVECRKRGIPYIMVVQAGIDWEWLPDDQIALAREVYLGAHASLFVSRSNLELVSRQLGAYLETAQVVRNPFQVPYDIRLPWPCPEDPLRLACVGRLHPRSKGQDLLFEVLRSRKWRERNLRVSLFGAGPNEGVLRSLAGLYGLESVHFAGVTRDVSSIWRAHHMLVLPSRIEGLPLALVESALCARPAVVTDVAGNAEVVSDGVSGFVAAPSVKALEGAMERAWESRHSLKLMGEEAARVIRQYVPADPVGVFATWLASIVSGGARSSPPAMGWGDGQRRRRDGNVQTVGSICAQ